MKRSIILGFLFGSLLFVHDTESLGRGRGGGGFRGGGGGAAYRGGGAVGGARAVQGYGGGGGVGARTTTPVVGARGGTGAVSRGSGSYTTNRGTTIEHRGRTVGGTTPGGISGARHIGGTQITGPGGREVTNVNRGAGVVGPAGNAVGGRAGGTIGTGPGGAIGNRYKGGVAVGPQGAVGGGVRAGGVAGPGGVAGGATYRGAAAGPYGAAAGRTTVAAGRGTYYRSTTAIRNQGVYVRQGVAHYPCFRAGWYTRYPGAWYATAWTAGAVWRACTWPMFVNYGYPVEPVYYDYGINIVYQDNDVYMDGEKVASAEEYAQQAASLADDGKTAKVSKDEEWTPLGVFAMVQGEETTSNHIFQLSINKNGVIRGNYYDAVTDSTSQIYGTADKKTQRAAWTVGDTKTPIYEVGIANLTKDATTMIVHYGDERSQQFSLVRIESPPDAEKK